jgi:hypothetical protein
VRVLSLTGRDVAGVGIRTQQAFARHAPGWTFDHVATRRSPWGYPAGLPASAVPRLLRRADVVHVHNHYRVADHYGWDGPTVITHHGSVFRRHYQELLIQQHKRGAIGLATTLDLWLMAPADLEWAPPCYDLEALAAHRRSIDDGVLRIGHAPTNRGLKSTEALMAAVERLSRDVRCELVLIEGKPWAECLAIKGMCDVLFDQTAYGYGLNAVEAWAMGIPVIAGADGDTLAEMRRRFGRIPFTLATEDTIEDALRYLVDPERRYRAACVGLSHVRHYHSELYAVAQLREVYQRAHAA